MKVSAHGGAFVAKVPAVPSRIAGAHSAVTRKRPRQPSYCYHNAVSNIKFAWDNRKANSNLAKHGVSFEEAKTAFLDENGRLLNDPDHSENEDRFLLLAYSV